LKDESKRRDYDLIYPSITRRRTFPRNTQTPHPPPTSASQPETLCEAAQIAAIQKSKQERIARWKSKKNSFSLLIFELQRLIQRLEQEITNLDTIFAAEAAAEAQKNSWAAWFLSPIYKKAEDSEEEKERKDRARQERRIEKDMKERRLNSHKGDLKTQENLLKIAEDEVDAATRSDDGKIRVIQARIWARENRERRERENRERERREKERQERERQERERMAKIRKEQQEQWMKREREATEASRKQTEEKRAAEQKRKKPRKFQEQHAHPYPPEESTGQGYTSACRHDGWWPKVQGRAACLRCYESWTYLLECPGCMMKACPRCQAAIRPRVPRNAARTNRTFPQRVRTPSPNFDFHHDWLD
jgi:hypothetical protein